MVAFFLRAIYRRVWGWTNTVVVNAGTSNIPLLTVAWRLIGSTEALSTGCNR